MQSNCFIQVPKESQLDPFLFSLFLCGQPNVIKRLTRKRKSSFGQLCEYTQTLS